jgi:hypothetical protein
LTRSSAIRIRQRNGCRDRYGHAARLEGGSDPSNPFAALLPLPQIIESHAEQARDETDQPSLLSVGASALQRPQVGCEWRLSSTVVRCRQKSRRKARWRDAGTDYRGDWAIGPALAEERDLSWNS